MLKLKSTVVWGMPVQMRLVFTSHIVDFLSQNSQAINTVIMLVIREFATKENVNTAGTLLRVSQIYNILKLFVAVRILIVEWNDYHSYST